MLLLSYLLFIKLTIPYAMVLSGTPTNSAIFFFLNCFSYSSNITGKNYDSFCSYDNTSMCMST